MAWILGAYLWSDCGYRAGYRMQVSARRKTYRLISPSGRVLVRGSRDEVIQPFESITSNGSLASPTGTVIVLLHGLAVGAWSVGTLHRFLRQNYPGADVVSFQYASTAAPVQTHARDLIDFLDFAKSAERVHFVAHSLGNIVLRHAYFLSTQNQCSLPSLGRHVMLGPPNHGATHARILNWLVPLRLANGPVFRQLGKDWPEFEKVLALPPCEYGIIAGDIGIFNRVSCLLSGPNDLIVTVEETRLPTAKDILIVPRSHLGMLFSRSVCEACLSFLQSGRFHAGY